MSIKTPIPLGAAMATLCLVSSAFAQTAPAEPAPSKETTDTQLREVKVKADREPNREDKGYLGGLSTAGKIPQLPRDIPQSTTTVSGQLMHDRNADTFREALRNVAGLTFNAGEGGRIGDNITLRGYSAVGDLYLDGMRDIAQYNREVFNLEQIDVLRGSASMLYGRGSTGGIINQVSKIPFLTDRSEVQATLGSFNYKRLTVDLNRILGGNINNNSAIRLNAMVTDTDSFRDVAQQNRWGVAPSLRFGTGSKHDLTLAYMHLKEDNVPDYGVPYFNNRPIPVPVNRFYGLASDYEKNETGIATLSYKYTFAHDGFIRTVVRHSDYERDLRVTAPRLVGAPTQLTDDVIINRGRPARGANEKVVTSQTDYFGKHNIIGMKHEVLAGVELVREKAHRWSNTSAIVNPQATVGNPDPFQALPSGYLESFTRTGDNYYRGRTIGIYAQDTAEIIKGVKLVAGARHDTFKADYDRPLPAGPLTRRDNVWSWRTGLIYQPNDIASYYASIGSSFNPSAELYQLDDRSTNTPPEKSRNIEIGAKFDLLDGNLSMRTALFRSQKTNERNTDLAVTIEQNLLSGKRHTDGIEFEVAGRINANWEIFGAVALMKARIDAATGQQAATLGKTPLNTPKNTYNLWSTYKLGPFKIGGGLEGAALRYASNLNTNALPAYTRVDALAEYTYKAIQLKMNVLNLLNRDYYEGVYSGHSTPGTKRSIQFSVIGKF